MEALTGAQVTVRLPSTPRGSLDAPISLRLPSNQLEQADELARDLGLQRSEVLRTAIGVGLSILRRQAASRDKGGP